MCGIVGIVSVERAPPIEGACDALRHRGPDDRGLWTSDDGKVAFGHRRLAILDLSEQGHQPLVKDDLVLTYNGEIYNYVALRRTLEARGHRFHTQTDTEVVLEAYRAFGDRCVEHFSGMFAFGLWDGAKRKLLLARDRLGIKPLYVYRDDSRLAFASELKAFDAIDGLSRAADEAAAYDFLTYLYVPAPKTAYRDVTKLLPAHVASFTEGRYTTRRYWSVDFASEAGPRGRDAVHAVREALQEAVRSHLVADVAVGCLLSGGIDSATIATLAAKQTADPLRTFSIGFDVESHSETHHARAVAERIAARHTEQIVRVDSARGTFGTLVDLYDEPFGDLSAIPTLEVCRVASEAVKVALSGDGGDEVFGGYTSYTRQIRRARLFSWVPPFARERLLPVLSGTLVEKLRGGPTLIDGLRDPLERHAVIQGGLTRADKERILPSAVMRQFAGYDDLWAFRAHDRPDLDPMTRFQIIDLNTYLPDDVLVKVDRASMAHSLELRPPFLDHALIELVASIPASVRNPGGRLKALLKDAVRPWLAEDIVDRKKKGFGVPLHVWGQGLAGRSDRRVGLVGNTVLATLSSWSSTHSGPRWATELGA